MLSGLEGNLDIVSKPLNPSQGLKHGPRFRWLKAQISLKTSKSLSGIETFTIGTGEAFRVWSQNL